MLKRHNSCKFMHIGKHAFMYTVMGYMNMVAMTSIIIIIYIHTNAIASE